MGGVEVIERVRTWCRHKAKDGRECALYAGHEGTHKEKHLASEWTDDE